jgi:hypothetical protein
LPLYWNSLLAKHLIQDTNIMHNILKGHALPIAILKEEHNIFSIFSIL